MSMLSDFVASVEAYAKAEEAKIAPIAQHFLSQVISDVEVALEDIAGIAVNAVLAQATNALTGQEKFGGAVTSVIQTVEAQGKTVAFATAQMATQQAFLAVQQVAQTVKSN